MSRSATNPTSKEVRKAIDSHLRKASDLALAHVELLARQVLRKNPKKLEEFIMAMGRAFFTVRNKIDSLDPEEIPSAKELDDLLYEYDNDLHLTGCPMRFTADGPMVRNW